MATKSSDVMMSIRLPKELRDSFAKVCEERNQTASRGVIGEKYKNLCGKSACSSN